MVDQLVGEVIYVNRTIYAGWQNIITMQEAELHANKWSITANAEEVDITTANNTGSMNFTTNLPRIEFRMDAIFDLADNPFGLNWLIVPGKRWNNPIIIELSSFAGHYPQLLLPAGIWTSFELTNSVREVFRFNATALLTALPELPGPNNKNNIYNRWNGDVIAVPVVG